MLGFRVLGKGVHLRQRESVEMGRFIVGEEVLHIELERFHTIIEGEADHVPDFEVLIATRSTILGLPGAPTGLQKLSCLFVGRVISTAFAKLLRSNEHRGMRGTPG